MKNKPEIMKKGKSIYKKTIYGSYVDTSLDGMVAQKNALFYKELLQLGYK